MYTGFQLMTMVIFRKLLPPNSPNLGLQLLRVGKLQLWLDRLRDAHHNISQVPWLVDEVVSFGKDGHSLDQLATEKKA